MFESLFLYSSRLFSKGEFLFASGWPVWLLALLCLVVVGGIGYVVFRRHGANLKGARWVVIAGLQALVLCLLLGMLWRPALRVTALKPQQNVVAVVVDDSRSMTLKHDGAAANGASRVSVAKALLNDGLLDRLRKRFQDLFTKGFVSQSALDQKTSVANAAKANLASSNCSREYLTRELRIFSSAESKSRRMAF